MNRDEDSYNVGMFLYSASTPDPRKILLWVLVVLLLVYLIGFFLVFASLRNFDRRLKKKLQAVAVLFASKRDLLLSLCAYYQKGGLALEENDSEKATKARWVSFDIKSGTDAQRIGAELTAFDKRLEQLGRANPALETGPEYERLKESLADVNLNYRQLAATYDYDLVGYDYWRKQFLYSWVFFLCGFRKRSRLV